MTAVNETSKNVAKDGVEFNVAWPVRALGAAVIVCLTAMAYLPALHGKMIWDDDSWTTRIEAAFKSWSGLRAIWLRPTELQQYYPLTGTTFWIDYQLWGFRTFPYHLENLLLHIASALLFWTLLRRLKVPGAWLAAAVFAVHPLMVESVAWITERKNVLSLPFFLGSILAYDRFSSFDSTQENAGPNWLAYGGAFVLLAAALLAKATAFSMPAVILLILWWKRGTIRWRTDLLPTLPFFALSIGFCLGTSWLEKNHVGANGPDWDITFPQRCLIAGHVVWFYAGKLAWPVNLCFVYPRWHLDARSIAQWAFPITAGVALFGLWLTRGRLGRGPITAALFYVGTLFPALGFMNAYYMSYSFVCDHWAYLSSLGPIALGASLAARLAGNRCARLYAAAPVLLGVLAFLTWRQSAIYADKGSLWHDTLKKNPDAWLAHTNLGMILDDQGQYDEAIKHYEISIKLGPNCVETYNDLGVALNHEEKYDEAIAEFQEAVRRRPDYVNARVNLGIALSALGRLGEASEQYQLALKYAPDSSDAHYYLAVDLERLGKTDDALAQYDKAVTCDSNNFNAQSDLGNLLFNEGRNEQAVEHFKEAARIRPDSPETRNNLAAVLLQTGRTAEAIENWNEALRLNPNYTDAANSLAWVLATNMPARGGDAIRAVALAEHACDLTSDRVAEDLDTLAAAYAAAGRFNDAVRTAKKALEMARSAGQPQQASEIEARLRLYQDGQAYRTDSGTN